MPAKRRLRGLLQIRKPRADKPYQRTRGYISPKPYLPDTEGTERHPSKSVAVAAACCSCFSYLMAFSSGAPFSPTTWFLSLSCTYSLSYRSTLFAPVLPAFLR